MKISITSLLRLLVVVFIFTVLLMAAGSVMSPPELADRLTPEQQSRSAEVLPLVSLVMASCLAYLTLRSRWHGWKLAGALFVVLYGIFTFLSQIETAVFPAIADQLPAGTLRGFFLSGLILAIPFSLLAVLVLGKTRQDPLDDKPNHRLRMPLEEWVWKLAAASVMYVFVYFSFGYYVAWRTPGLPEFYGGIDPGSFLGQMRNVMIDTPWLPVFQVFRGLVWTAVGCVIMRMHKGKEWETAVAVGAAFSLLMATALLFPNPFMPAVIARAHAIELFSSNFVYGIMLTTLMLWKPSNINPRSKEASHAY